MENKESKKVTIKRKEVQFCNHVCIQDICFCFQCQSERRGIWMQYALDRERFKKRINQLNILLSKVFIEKNE